MLSKSEILMSLNRKQKPLCQQATAELFANEETAKNDKSAFGSDALDKWFLIYATTRSLVSWLDSH